MKKNLTKIMMMALCLCMMVAMFAFVASAEETVEKIDISEAEIILSKNYCFFNGAVQSTPEVTVELDGEKLTEGYDIVWKYEGEEVTGLEHSGRYTVTVTGKEDAGYTGSKKAYCDVLSNRLTAAKYAVKFNDIAGWVYGAPLTMAGIEDEIVTDFDVTYKFAQKFIEFRAVGDSEFTSEMPTEVGKYEVRAIYCQGQYYAIAIEEFEITPKKVVIVLKDKTIEYGGDEDFEFYFADPSDYTKEINLIGEDDLGVEIFREDEENKFVNMYDIFARYDEDNKNYDVVDVAKATLTIVPRVLTAADFENNLVVTYNGKLQLPEYKIVDPSFADDVYELEILGARKYGGTYTARIVSIDNDNYVLEGDIKLQYTIVAEDGKDGDAAVDKIETGLGNAGSAMESIAPTLGNIGGSIVDTIVAVFKAIFADFFGRVFGA